MLGHLMRNVLPQPSFKTIVASLNLVLLGLKQSNLEENRWRKKKKEDGPYRGELNGTAEYKIG